MIRDQSCGEVVKPQCILPVSHKVQVLVLVLAVPVLIKLCTAMPGKSEQDDKSLGSCMHVGYLVKLLAPSFCLAQV